MHIANLEAHIQGLEISLQGGYSKELEADLLAFQLELSIWMDREETHFPQQMKQTWLQKGEANIGFLCALSKKNRNLINRMRLGDGTVFTSLEQIHMGAVEYFHKFLEARLCTSLPNLDALVDKVITDEYNIALC